MYAKTERALKDTMAKAGILLRDKKVLDAGAGIGMFCGFYLKRGAKMVAVDLSDEALSILKKKYPTVKTQMKELENLKESSLGKFDIVHCFDVLYHITNDKKWEEVLNNFATLSKKYIIIHDKYPYFGYSFFEKGHVKVRKPEKMRKILGKRGFKEIVTTPTHFFFVRPILHLVIGVFPQPFYYLDKAFSRMGTRKLQTTYIRVFERI
jgi:SAM-dependent methyltransferase